MPGHAQHLDDWNSYPVVEVFPFGKGLVAVGASVPLVNISKYRAYEARSRVMAYSTGIWI